MQSSCANHLVVSSRAVRCGFAVGIVCVFALCAALLALPGIALAQEGVAQEGASPITANAAEQSAAGGANAGSAKSASVLSLGDASSPESATASEPAVPSLRSTAKGAGGEVWERLWGSTALDTMVEVSKEGWSTSNAVVIATSEHFADVLSACPLAGSLDAPVLLSRKAKLPTQTANEIARLKAKRAYIVGGPAALSENVAAQLRRAGCTVERVYGATASDTAAAVADYCGSARSKTAVIATNASYRDALSIAPYAYKTTSPIYLASQSGQVLCDAARRSLAAGGYTRAVVVGGPLAISETIDVQLKSLGISKVERVWGQNAEGTSSRAADWSVKQGMSPAKVGLATSGGFPDALVGAALCGRNNAPILLASDKNRSVVYSFVNRQRAKIKHGYVFGGPLAVSTATESLVLAGTAKAAYSNLEDIDIAGFTRLGIDVSQWQGSIDWQKVKESGIDFAIVRVAHGAGEGSVVDLQYVRNLREAKAAGVQLGVYIYSDADTVAGAREEANRVVGLLRSAGVAAADIPLGVYYDLEEKELEKLSNRSLLLDMTKAFMSAMESSGYRRLGVYSNLYWWTYFLPSEEYDQWWRWIAQYNDRCDYFGVYKMWQFSCTGTVPGIVGNVDMDLGYW